MTLKDKLIHLSDIIDMHDYNENWEKEAQALITEITKEECPEGSVPELFPGMLESLDGITIRSK